MNILSAQQKAKIMMIALKYYRQYEEYKQYAVDWWYAKVLKKPRFNLDTMRTAEGRQAYFQWLSNRFLKKNKSV